MVVKFVKGGTIRHQKELKRRGLNVASGNFPVGSNVRIRNKRK